MLAFLPPHYPPPTPVVAADRTPRAEPHTAYFPLAVEHVALAVVRAAIVHEPGRLSTDGHNFVPRVAILSQRVEFQKLNLAAALMADYVNGRFATKGRLLKNVTDKFADARLGPHSKRNGLWTYLGQVVLVKSIIADPITRYVNVCLMFHVASELTHTHWRGYHDLPAQRV